MNLGELVRADGGIFRTLGLIQKPAHAAVATHRTNSLQLLRQIDCRCAVINTEQVTGQTIAPIFGEVTNLGDGIEPIFAATWSGWSSAPISFASASNGRSVRDARTRSPSANQIMPSI